jgi:hypothetical protein
VGRVSRGGEGRLLALLAEVVDAEVARWRARARDDADARLVLRAFLALRELLAEAGAPAAEPDLGDAGPRRPAAARPRRARAARAPGGLTAPGR